MRKFYKFVFCYFLLGAMMTANTQTIIAEINGIVYVDLTKTGDGSSCSNAYPNLADLLIYAAKQRAGLAGPIAPTDTIRAFYVAEGTYYPMYDAIGYDIVSAVKNVPETDGGLHSRLFSPTLANLTIIGNSASSFGGGIYNGFSTPTFVNVAVSGLELLFAKRDGMSVRCEKD